MEAWKSMIFFKKRYKVYLPSFFWRIGYLQLPDAINWIFPAMTRNFMQCFKQEANNPIDQGKVTKVTQKSGPPRNESIYKRCQKKNSHNQRKKENLKSNRKHPGISPPKSLPKKKTDCFKHSVLMCLISPPISA